MLYFREVSKVSNFTYPSHALLVLDDFMGLPLLSKKDSTFIRMMAKTRRYNLTVVQVAQIIRFVTLNRKRLATDVVLASKYSDEDFLAVLDQTPNDVNKKEPLE